MFSFLQLVKVKEIGIEISKRALTYASETASKTMCCHVSFLINMWIASHYPIEDFPIEFFDCENLEDFYTQFRKEISVEFFQKSDTEGLVKLANFFSLEPMDLVKVSNNNEELLPIS